LLDPDEYDSSYPEFLTDELSDLYFDIVLFTSPFYSLSNLIYVMASTLSKEFDSILKLESDGANYSAKQSKPTPATTSMWIWYYTWKFAPFSTKSRGIDSDYI